MRSKIFSNRLNQSEFNQEAKLVSSEQNIEKFAGFDFLRAIFSVIVVALHADLFNVFSGKPKLEHLSDILDSNVGYLAVPVFLQISLFLFGRKIGSKPNYFLNSRLPKLIYLYLFWLSLLLLTKYIFQQGSTHLESLSVSNLSKFIVTGGSSPYYFFVSLIFLSALFNILSFQLAKSNEIQARISANYKLLAGSCVLVFFFSIIDLVIGNYSGSHTVLLTSIVNHFNFLPYIFTSAIAVEEFRMGVLRKNSPTLRLKLLLLCFLSITFIILEWLLFKHFPHYSRLSLVFSSWLFLYLALLSTQKIPATIKLISGYSLGIYGFHVLFTQVIFTETSISLTPLSERLPGLAPLSEFLIALLGSIALTAIFKKVKLLRNFV